MVGLVKGFTFLFQSIIQSMPQIPVSALVQYDRARIVSEIVYSERIAAEDVIMNQSLRVCWSVKGNKRPDVQDAETRVVEGVVINFVFLY